MSNELKPCPFCGQQEAFVEQLDSDASVVICQGRVGEHSACLARGPVGVQESDNESQPGYAAAVREWNQRAANELHAPGEEPEVVYILRNTEIGSPWRNANKAAFDSAAGLSNYERRELVDHKYFTQLHAEVERHKAGIKWESDRNSLLLARVEELEAADSCWAAVIDYMLGAGSMEEPMEFLRLWNEGAFDSLRKEWPDAPEEVYLADPVNLAAPIDKPIHEQNELIGWISTRQLDAFKKSRRSSWTFSVDRTESETRAIPIFGMRVKS